MSDSDDITISGSEFSDYASSFSADESDDEIIYDVIEIVKERKGQYLVRWDGVDPKGKPWPDTWIDKHEVVEDIVEEWTLKKLQRKTEKQQRNGVYQNSYYPSIPIHDL